jgi:hypothetical protein
MSGDERPPAARASVRAALLPELHIARARQPLTDRWRRVQVERRGAAALGISFRPHQADALGLDQRETLAALLAYPFTLIRLGAYWNNIEPELGAWRPEALDWQVDAAERAGKQIILNVGAVKTFGYPEFFAPAHVLHRKLREGALVTPEEHPALIAGATAFVTRVIERYRDHPAIVAWQVEHEAVDPLGMEHSWRLSEAFVRLEVAAARVADPSRPIMMNGFLPTSRPVRAQQWWRTRDQGDSLAVARCLADIVGVDYYPRHALAGGKSWAAYLDGGGPTAGAVERRRLFEWARAGSGRLMVSEGQAEPWESVTTPPNPRAWGMYSCLPEHLIENYTQWMDWARLAGASLSAYLFWGAEYWLLRQRSGDPSYIQAFARVLDEA